MNEPAAAQPAAQPAQEQPVQEKAETKPEPSAVQETPKQEKRRYKVKVDGAELDVDEDTLVSGYQLSRASQKRMEEAAKMTKQAEAFVQALVKDPVAVLTDPRFRELGVDFKKIAEDYIIQEYERSQMTPEQRELAEAKRKLQEIENAKRAEEEEKQTAAERAETERHTKQYAEELEDTLARANLPKSTMSLRMAAYLKKQALEAEYDMPPSELAARCKEAMHAETREFLGNHDGDDLLELLGEDLRAVIREAELARYRRGNGASPAPKDQPSNGASPKRFRNLDERLAAWMRDEI